jgi:hypothetical protein
MALTDTTQHQPEILNEIHSETSNAPEWGNIEKYAFRFAFIFLILQIVPIDIDYYKQLLTLDWSSPHVSQLFYLARYAPTIFAETPVFLDWLVLLGVAAAGAFIWGIIDDGRREYNALYYLLRVVVRYRLAAALLAYGFIKLFPLQMPFPSISNLNTNYGDFEAWKIFSMSTGIVPGYQSFLGGIEIVTALLLLNRKTATIGAFMVLPFTGNVVLSNLAYEGGEYVYGTLLVLFAAFLFLYDFVRLYRFSNEQPVAPHQYVIAFWTGGRNRLRIASKLTFFFLFIFAYGYLSYDAYKVGGYQYPTSPGLAKAEGLYNVSEFIVNGKKVEPSRTDPARWRDVVFERWSTLSVRANYPVSTASVLTEEIESDQRKRPYEFSGNTGRRFYTYQIDSLNATISLTDRILGVSRYTFKVERPDSIKIILKGREHTTNDSLVVVLDRIDKKYLLEEAAKHGRRRGLKL